MTSHPLSLLVEAGSSATPIVAITSGDLDGWLAAQSEPLRVWLKALGFKGDVGATALIPGGDGGISMVLLGLGNGDEPWATGALAKTLPKGTYRIVEVHGGMGEFATWAAMAWALGGYTFGRYRSGDAAPEFAKLEWPKECDRGYVTRAVNGTVLTRDLINTPAADMMPDDLEKTARRIAQEFGAKVNVVTGDDLLTQNFPMIHAVGRASSVAPRLIDMVWGEVNHPKVTLVGKGVCFDSGGLDIKPSSAMALMKKDMGGAACVLGLAHMLMAANTPIRLRVLVPAVENAVSGNSFRPGDVLKTRKGITVEIGNTDAEGRLVLGDALTLAMEDSPALVIDCATLTGACRTALGPEIPGLFTDDDLLAADFWMAATTSRDPLWRLPLWQPYRRMIDSKIADINNAGDSPFAGAITAALFLKEFAKPKNPDAKVPWAHLDLYAWNPAEKPGRSQGGDAMAQRALYALIQKRFA